MNLERELKQFILKILLQAKEQPINDDTLKRLVRAAYHHVAIPAAALERVIGELKRSGLIAGVQDEIFGLAWTLSLKGKSKAQQIR
jgi:hypothetical protein